MINDMPLRLLQPMNGDPWDLEAYIKRGGYEAWQQCIKGNSPDKIIGELKHALLRGRGGAGFPTGLKWEKVLHNRVKERYFVCNAGEHEPGTFKDRYLIKHFPHQLLEGCLIAAYTVNAQKSYIYLNAEFKEAKLHLQKAMDEAKQRGYLGNNVFGSGIDIDIEIFDGPGS